MSKFVIEGGQPIHGTFTASGNKNAVLPMLAAALLTEQEVTLENVPQIADVRAMLELYDHLGVEHHLAGTTLRIRAAKLTTHDIPWDLTRKVRTSFLFAAPLLHRLGRAQLNPPGGDVIGRRRLDAHFYGLEKLGATVDQEKFSFTAKQRLHGAELFFDEASVTATEHLLMAAVLADGQTIIRNAASEPHVQDLAKLLVAMGAEIAGINTNTLTIDGVDFLHGATHRVVSDHIEVGSYLALAAATGGELTVHDTVRSHYWMIHRVFERFNVKLQFSSHSIHLPGGQQPSIQVDVGGAVPRVDDGPWPQFPSDLMSPLVVLATQSQGVVLFFEKMFESRMFFTDPLSQMGANIIICDPHRIVVSGKCRLRGLPVRSPDIRAGMALLMAALCASGTSTVYNAEIIDRGYAAIETTLQNLGARITRQPD